jgi:hypothetical protein
MIPYRIRTSFCIYCLINRVNIMLHLLSNKWFLLLYISFILHIWMLKIVIWCSISTKWIIFLPHQRYFLLIYIILFFSPYLHTLTFHQAQYYRTNAFYAFIHIIHFFSKNFDLVYQFHIHTLQIRFLSLI